MFFSIYCTRRRRGDGDAIIWDFPPVNVEGSVVVAARALHVGAGLVVHRTLST